MAILVALALTSCTEEATLPTAEPLTFVIATPVAFADSIFLVAGTTPGGFVEPLGGAAFSIRTRDTTLRLSEASTGDCGFPTGSACYRGVTHGRILPGDSLRLVGTTGSGREVSGAARVPDVPDLTILGYGNADTIRGRVAAFDEVPATVLGLEGVPGMVTWSDTLAPTTVWTPSGAVSCGTRPFDLPRGIDLRGFTLILRTPDRPCAVEPDFPWDSVAVDFTFLAYDQHFTAWSALSAQRQPGASHGIEGVFGVFGAATPKRFVLVQLP